MSAKTALSILGQRLFAQKISHPNKATPEDIVFYMGAMQAQEFAMAKWAIGLRMPAATETLIDTAFNDGKILRTHLLRPTWHFVSQADIRWLLQLTAPRVHQANAYMYRQSELDASVFLKATGIIEKMLQGNCYLTREELQTGLAQKKIVADGFRLAYIMMYAELEGIICSGPRMGNQFTYALIEERVPPQKNITREDALRTLLLRYFTSRGLATAKDFSYWSGLTLAETNKGIKSADNLFHIERINNEEYYYTSLHKTLPALRTFLMPDYDEYGASYKNRDVLRHPGFSGQITFNRMVVLDGLIIGTWKRDLKAGTVNVDLSLNITPNPKQVKQLQAAAETYSTFLEKTLRLNILSL